MKPSNAAPGWMPKVLLVAGFLLMALALAGILLQTRGQPAPAAEQSSDQSVDIPTNPPYSGPVRVGAALRDFALKDINGKQVKLSDFSGREVLINTWATWCPPCKAEMPDLNAFYEKHKDSGFIILGVNAGESRDLAAGFANQLNLSFPILLDSDEYVVDSMGIRDFPTSILVGRDGKVQDVQVGMFTPDMLEQRILPLIK